MIREDSFTDRIALELFKEALRDLTLRAPLAGFSYLGEAVVVVQERGIKTLCTDGRKVYVSPDWMRKLDLRARIFDILHEWIHIFMNHVARRGDRDGHLWNIACDCVVVRECCTMLGAGWEAPKDGVIPPLWTMDLSAEEIYQKLLEAPKRVEGLRHAPGEGEEPQPSEISDSTDFMYDAAEEYTPQEEEIHYAKFQDEVAQAAVMLQQIKSAELSAAVQSRLEQLLSGRLPWSFLLRGNLLADMGHEMATYVPPNRRTWPWYIAPSYKALKERVLMLIIDVSASVGQRRMNTFIANTGPAAARAERTLVVTFDEVIREQVWVQRPHEALKKVKFLTGAHNYTDARPVFELVDQIKPTGLAMMTDGYIMLPEKPYPKTIFVTPQEGKKLPWGRNYVMEDSW